MQVLDQPLTAKPEYTELTRRTHPSELMMSGQDSNAWLDHIDFLFWSIRQRDADTVVDYDV